LEASDWQQQQQYVRRCAVKHGNHQVAVCGKAKQKGNKSSQQQQQQIEVNSCLAFE